MKMRILLVSLFFYCTAIHAQELYVFSEPASNMPAHSVAVKQSFKGLSDKQTGANNSRYTTEIMLGVNKNLMVHGLTGFSNMYSSHLRWESATLYAKYRFLSHDALYSHFRMAAFAKGTASRNKPVYQELSLDGDQSGAGAGLIATQLMHKLAISTTLGFSVASEVLRTTGGRPEVNITPRGAFDYSLSAGYLVLPAVYKSYNQTNLNLYVELLGQRTVNPRYHYIDLAPAAQLIFNSQAKLNLGYRFQLNSNMYRMAERSWMVSFEWLFLN